MSTFGGESSPATGFSAADEALVVVLDRERVGDAVIALAVASVERSRTSRGWHGRPLDASLVSAVSAHERDVRDGLVAVEVKCPDAELVLLARDQVGPRRDVAPPRAARSSLAYDMSSELLKTASLPPTTSSQGHGCPALSHPPLPHRNAAMCEIHGRRTLVVSAPTRLAGRCCVGSSVPGSRGGCSGASLRIFSSAWWAEARSALIVCGGPSGWSRRCGFQSAAEQLPLDALDVRLALLALAAKLVDRGRQAFALVERLLERGLECGQRRRDVLALALGLDDAADQLLIDDGNPARACQ